MFLRLHYESEAGPASCWPRPATSGSTWGASSSSTRILTHLTRVALTNQWASLQYSKALSDSVRVRALVGAASGSPDREYQLFLTDSRDAYYRPNYGYKSLNGQLELSFTLPRPLPQAGRRQRAGPRGAAVLHPGAAQPAGHAPDPRRGRPHRSRPTRASADSLQLGAYLQLSGNPIPSVSDLILTGNGRVDFINFGDVTFPRQYSWRAALAYRWSERFTTKVVGGRAFQTPSGTLLYSQGGVGNTRNVIGSERLQEPARLRPQVVTSVDVVAAAQFGSFATLEATGFHQLLDDAIEFVQAGPFFVARNRGQRTTSGLELTLRLALGAFYPYAVASLTRNALDSLQGGRAPRALPGSLRLRGHRLRPGDAATSGPTSRSAGPAPAAARRATSTPTTRGRTTCRPTPTWGPPCGIKQLRLLAPNLETRLLASVRNLLDQRRLEPGFAGIDIPQPGRTFMLSIHQDL